MSAPEGPGPLSRLFHGALLVLGAVMCLWLAIKLIESAWLWFLAGLLVVVAGTTTWLIWWLRRRRW